MKKTKTRRFHMFLGPGALLPVLLLCFILGWSLSQPVWALEGSGTGEDPYLIKSAEDLHTVRDTVYLTGGYHFRLETDLDLSQSVYNAAYEEGRGWVPIGSEESPFTGTFDGGGKTISHLTINRPEEDNVGLFGRSENATLTNMQLDGVEITGRNYVGGLVGFASGSDISSIYIAPGIYITPCSGGLTGEGTVGGLVGYNDGGTISGSHIAVDVTGVVGEGGSGQEVGGLAGYNDGGTITNSYATGTVTGTFSVGGLVGLNCGEITVSRAAGAVKGDCNAGGLVGDNEGFISDSHAMGNVEGEGANIGGLVGQNESDTITRSCAAGNVTGWYSVGGLVGVNFGTISESFAAGKAEGVDESGSQGVGGLVGTNDGEITNAYATGSVKGIENVGGLAGTNDGKITNAYAAGSVTGNDNAEKVGGLVGDNGGLVIDSYYDLETTNQPGDGFGASKNTAEMMKQTTFAGWDFDDIWAIREDVTYPYFGWQSPVVVAASTNTLGTVITIAFDIEMASPAGKQGQFSATVGGTARTFTGAALDAGNAAKINLTLSGSPIRHGQSVTVSYTAGMVTAADGEVMAGFTDRPVTNNVPASSSGGGGGSTTAPVIGKVNPPDGTMGSSYIYTFTASGGKPSYTFAVTGGALPQGLILAENGTLSGTPVAVGTYNYTVTITDRAGKKSSHTFTQVIKDGSGSVQAGPRVIILTVDSLEATVDGRPYTLDAAFYISPGADRTLVPIRFICEGIGAQVDWNAAARQVLIKDAGKKIVLTIGSKEVLVDGKRQTIDCPPELIPPGWTFVPLRFIAETLGARVDYESPTGRITITR